MQNFTCTANIQSANNGLRMTIERIYSADSLKKAQEGFTQYLHSNRTIATYWDVRVEAEITNEVHEQKEQVNTNPKAQIFDVDEYEEECPYCC